MTEISKYSRFNEAVALMIAVSEYIKKNTAVLEKEELCEQDAIEEIFKRG